MPPVLTLKVILDTCILKLATLPQDNNLSALIVEMGLRGLYEWWVSPSILEEYIDVLSDEPEFLTEITEKVQVCYPLTVLSVIRHEPDNRFIETAFAVRADFLITVNTAKGHFDQKRYGLLHISTPGQFVEESIVQPLLKKLYE